MSLIALCVHAKFDNFRYIIVGLNVGLCAFGFPDLFTTFFSDSISNWVQTVVESDGETGVVGSGVGRVELSICKEIKKPTEETVKGGYQVRALKVHWQKFCNINFSHGKWIVSVDTILTSSHGSGLPKYI